MIIACNSDDPKYVLPSILSPPLSWHTFETSCLLMWCFNDQLLPTCKLFKICRCHGSPVSSNMTVVQKAAKFLGALTSLSHLNSQLWIISTPLMRSTFSIHGFQFSKRENCSSLGSALFFPSVQELLVHYSSMSCTVNRWTPLVIVYGQCQPHSTLPANASWNHNS